MAKPSVLGIQPLVFGDLLFLPQSGKWNMGPSKASFISIRVVFHFHDYGRKGTPHTVHGKKRTTELQYPLISLQLDP